MYLWTNVCIDMLFFDFLNPLTIANFYNAQLKLDSIQFQSCQIVLLKVKENYICGEFYHFFN